MTVEEAYQQYGAKTHIVSEGENIVFLTRRLYNSDNDNYVNILKVLNPRVNWLSMPAGTVIQYLDPDVVNSILY